MRPKQSDSMLQNYYIQLIVAMVGHGPWCAAGFGGIFFVLEPSAVLEEKKEKRREKGDKRGEKEGKETK